MVAITITVTVTLSSQKAMSCRVALIQLSHEYFFVVGNDSGCKRKWVLKERGGANRKSRLDSTSSLTGRERVWEHQNVNATGFLRDRSTLFVITKKFRNFICRNTRATGA